MENKGTVKADPSFYSFIARATQKARRRFCTVLHIKVTLHRCALALQLPKTTDQAISSRQLHMVALGCREQAVRLRAPFIELVTQLATWRAGTSVAPVLRT